MTLPEGAKFEALLSDKVALYDVSHLLAKHKTKTYQKRDPKNIDTIILHKSGADGRAGFQGMQDCVRYVVQSREPEFPGMPYTFWLPRSPSLDAEKRFVVYRGQPDDVVSWHTGGRMNHRGVGIGVQGNYDGDGGAFLRTPTPAQWVMVEALVDWLLAQHNIDLGKEPAALTGHFEHGKPVCPGDAIVDWLRRRRGENVAVPEPLAPKAEEVDPRSFGIADRQKALTLLGFTLGTVDGLWGLKSREALEKFQKASALHVDGVWGAKTSAAIFAALKKKNLHTKKAFQES